MLASCCSVLSSQVTGVVEDREGTAHYILSGTWDDKMESAKIVESSHGGGGSEGKQKTVYQTLQPKLLWKKYPLPWVTLDFFSYWIKDHFVICLYLPAISLVYHLSSQRKCREHALLLLLGADFEWARRGRRSHRQPSATWPATHGGGTVGWSKHPEAATGGASETGEEEKGGAGQSGSGRWWVHGLSEFLTTTFPGGVLVISSMKFLSNCCKSSNEKKMREIQKHSEFFWRITCVLQAKTLRVISHYGLIGKQMRTQGMPPTSTKGATGRPKKDKTGASVRGSSRTN